MEPAILKRESVLSIFGSKYGTKLLNWLDPCCEEFCGSVLSCLAISATGNPVLFLNQQGQFVTASGGTSDAWLLSGNSGTNPGTAFLGTLDAEPLKIGTNNSVVIQITPGGGITLFGSVTIPSSLALTPGGGLNKILTSDAFGNATWQSAVTVTQINGTGGVPTIVAKAGAGTGAVVSVSGTSVGGIISVTIGTSPGIGSTILTVTYPTVYPTSSFVTITPANSFAAALSGGLGIWVNTTAVEFNIVPNTGPLVTGTTYEWYYHVVGI